MNVPSSRMHGRHAAPAASVICALAAILAWAPAFAGGVHFSYADKKHDPNAFQYAIIESGSQTTCSVWGEQVWDQIGRLQKEVKATGREVMWFSIGENEYVVRDAAAVRRALEIVEPMSALGKQQGELGARQGELGARQGELGALQGRIGALQGRVARLEAATRDPETRREAAEIRRELAQLNTQANSLGQRQRDLGQRQRVLGEQQRVLGERQREASLLANEQLRDLAEKALRDGTAERF